MAAVCSEGRSAGRLKPVWSKNSKNQQRSPSGSTEVLHLLQVCRGHRERERRPLLMFRCCQKSGLDADLDLPEPDSDNKDFLRVGLAGNFPCGVHRSQLPRRTTVRAGVCKERHTTDGNATLLPPGPCRGWKPSLELPLEPSCGGESRQVSHRLDKKHLPESVQIRPQSSFFSFFFFPGLIVWILSALQTQLWVQGSRSHVSGLHGGLCLLERKSGVDKRMPGAAVFVSRSHALRSTTNKGNCVLKGQSLGPQPAPNI